MSECKECGIRLRKRRETVEDVPGSRRQDGQGLCVVCSEHRKKEAVMKCVRCEQPVRPYLALAEDHPGTVGVRGGGLCRSCSRLGSADPVRPVFDLLQTRSALEGYLAARRRRVGPE